jgi:hypothetical protein
MTGTFLGINEGRVLTLDYAKGTSVFSRLAKRRAAIVTASYCIPPAGSMFCGDSSIDNFHNR